MRVAFEIFFNKSQGCLFVERFLARKLDYIVHFDTSQVRPTHNQS